VLPRSAWRPAATRRRVGFALPCRRLGRRGEAVSVEPAYPGAGAQALQALDNDFVAGRETAARHDDDAAPPADNINADAHHGVAVDLPHVWTVAIPLNGERRDCRLVHAGEGDCYV
jgi:hypothetical protein